MNIISSFELVKPHLKGKKWRLLLDRMCETQTEQAELLGLAGEVVDACNQIGGAQVTKSALTLVEALAPALDDSILTTLAGADAAAACVTFITSSVGLLSDEQYAHLLVAAAPLAVASLAAYPANNAVSDVVFKLLGVVLSLSEFQTSAGKSAASVLTSLMNSLAATTGCDDLISHITTDFNLLITANKPLHLVLIELPAPARRARAPAPAPSPATIANMLSVLSVSAKESIPQVVGAAANVVTTLLASSSVYPLPNRVAALESCYEVFCTVLSRNDRIPPSVCDQCVSFLTAPLQGRNAIRGASKGAELACFGQDEVISDPFAENSPISISLASHVAAAALNLYLTSQESLKALLAVPKVFCRLIGEVSVAIERLAARTDTMFAPSQPAPCACVGSAYETNLTWPNILHMHSSSTTTAWLPTFNPCCRSVAPRPGSPLAMRRPPRRAGPACPLSNVLMFITTILSFCAELSAEERGVGDVLGGLAAAVQPLFGQLVQLPERNELMKMLLSSSSRFMSHYAAIEPQTAPSLVSFIANPVLSRGAGVSGDVQLGLPIVDLDDHMIAIKHLIETAFTITIAHISSFHTTDLTTVIALWTFSLRIQHDFSALHDQLALALLQLPCTTWGAAFGRVAAAEIGAGTRVLVHGSLAAHMIARKLTEHANNSSDAMNCIYSALAGAYTVAALGRVPVSVSSAAAFAIADAAIDAPTAHDGVTNVARVLGKIISDCSSACMTAPVTALIRLTSTIAEKAGDSFWRDACMACSAVATAIAGATVDSSASTTIYPLIATLATEHAMKVAVRPGLAATLVSAAATVAGSSKRNISLAALNTAWTLTETALSVCGDDDVLVLGAAVLGDVAALSADVAMDLSLSAVGCVSQCVPRLCSRGYDVFETADRLSRLINEVAEGAVIHLSNACDEGEAAERCSAVSSAIDRILTAFSTIFTPSESNILPGKQATAAFRRVVSCIGHTIVSLTSLGTHSATTTLPDTIISHALVMLASGAVSALASCDSTLMSDSVITLVGAVVSCGEVILLRHVHLVTMLLTGVSRSPSTPREAIRRWQAACTSNYGYGKRPLITSNEIEVKFNAPAKDYVRCCTPDTELVANQVVHMLISISNDAILSGNNAIFTVIADVLAVYVSFPGTSSSLRQLASSAILAATMPQQTAKQPTMPVLMPEALGGHSKIMSWTILHPISPTLDELVGLNKQRDASAHDFNDVLGLAKEELSGFDVELADIEAFLPQWPQPAAAPARFHIDEAPPAALQACTTTSVASFVALVNALLDDDYNDLEQLKAILSPLYMVLASWLGRPRSCPPDLAPALASLARRALAGSSRATMETVLLALASFRPNVVADCVFAAAFWGFLVDTDPSLLGAELAAALTTAAVPCVPTDATVQEMVSSASWLSALRAFADSHGLSQVLAQRAAGLGQAIRAGVPDGIGREVLPQLE